MACSTLLLYCLHMEYCKKIILLPNSNEKNPSALVSVIFSYQHHQTQMFVVFTISHARFSNEVYSLQPPLLTSNYITQVHSFKFASASHLNPVKENFKSIQDLERRQNIACIKCMCGVLNFGPSFCNKERSSPLCTLSKNFYR